MPQALAGFDLALAAKAAKGLAFRLTDFLHELIKLEQQAIDTPEERTAVSNALMKFYDENVNSHVPSAFRAKTREYVVDLVTATLVAAAGV